METTASKTFTNPLPIELADPFVLTLNGIYYLYGTHSPDSSIGVPVYTSQDLVNWDWRGFAFTKSVTTHAQRHFWNPEVIKYRDRFFMFFTGSPNTADGLPFNVQIYLAVADNPLGPFAELRAPLYNPPEPTDEAIDPAVLLAKDGRVFMYYALATRGRNEIWGVQLVDDLLSLAGEPVRCLTSEEEWESRPWEGHFVAEAPFAFMRSGVYYIVYTANHFLDPQYAVGFATATSPLGPWSKHPSNPILRGNDRITGTGCGVLAPSPSGEEVWMIYHVHERPGFAGKRRIALGQCRFRQAEDRGGVDILQVDCPTDQPCQYPR